MCSLLFRDFFALSVVERSVQVGLTGVECLSCIPGKVGSAIIQNWAAYGHEISQVLQDMDVYDTYSHRTKKLTRDARNLGYRSSRFKNEAPGLYVILTLTVRSARFFCKCFTPTITGGHGQ
jgi:UDP-N-acetylmuramate dehydrogenase